MLRRAAIIGVLVLLAQAAVAHAALQWQLVVSDINTDPQAGSDGAHPALIHAQLVGPRYDTGHDCTFEAEARNRARHAGDMVYYWCTTLRVR